MNFGTDMALQAGGLNKQEHHEVQADSEVDLATRQEEVKQ
jgi:hypothetical protein